jgi:hypothetical protein
LTVACECFRTNLDFADEGGVGENGARILGLRLLTTG